MRVKVPAEPPELTPEAALALFQVLVNARAQREGGRQVKSHEISHPVDEEGSA